MRIRYFVAMALASTLSACGGGDVNLGVDTTDNSVDNSTTTPPPATDNSGNPCASYTHPTTNAAVRGSFDGTNCTYGSNFVGVSNPLTVDLTIPLISGVHIFQDSLFVGQNVSTGTAPAAGTGPTLTIAAGNTLAFTDSADYVLINRGSRIVAEGSSAAPITFTGYTDAVSKTAGAEDVQLWGGIVINGNGLTNNCSDAERAASQCHVVSEGQPSNYGGTDNAESSGTLRYVVVKHTGFEVAPGDELNGITFNAVGSGTVVENIEVYSTYDDGVEFFGGAVNVKNLLAMYVRDDSIDFSDGFSGTIENALVIQSRTNGNRCIEGDNISESRSGAGQSRNTAPITHPTINNMTCILSNVVGTHGDSEGIRLREGARATLANTILFSGYQLDTAQITGAADSECLQIQHAEGLAAAAAGDTKMTNSIVACTDLTSGSMPNGDSQDLWVQGGGAYTFNTGNRTFSSPSATDSPNLRVLEANSFYTAPAFADESGAPFSYGTPTDPVVIGAVTRASDWTANWTYGLHGSRRGQALWFE